MNSDFKHPIGTHVWWVGYEYDNEVHKFVWKMCEREVTAIRTTLCKGDNKTHRQIFLSGLKSYEGENWFDDEYQTLKETDGTVWHCSGYMCDTVFDTEDEAKRYLEWELKQQKDED